MRRSTSLAATALFVTGLATGSVVAVGSGAAVATPAPQCSYGQLDVTKGGTQGTAGSVVTQLRFTNTGGTCTLKGYPKVRFVAHGNGTAVGAAAVHQKPKPKTVVLKHGATAKASLAIAEAGNFGGTCKAIKADGFRVYAPHQSKSYYVADPVLACHNPQVKQLTVRRLR